MRIGESPPNRSQIVHYVCPPGDMVAQLMAGLCAAADKMAGVDPLVRASVLAFGFVFIHPFEDGNGRIHLIETNMSYNCSFCWIHLMAKQKSTFKKNKIRIRWWWRRAHTRSKTGVVITVAYLVIMLITVLVRRDEFLKMELNALGDFLAGTFAPLGLLWLVIGYFQQGDELRQNSRALLLQAKELRQAAEHAGGLLEVARNEHQLAIEKLKAEQCEREAEAERATEAKERSRKYKLQPQIEFSPIVFRSGRSSRGSFSNNGKDCTAFVLDIPANKTLKLLLPVQIEYLKAHDPHYFSIDILTIVGNAAVMVRWVDLEGDPGELKYIAAVSEGRVVFNEVRDKT